ncbi:MAG: peptidylprolyl isomerase [Candidatus Omnitrophota bacterium]
MFIEKGQKILRILFILSFLIASLVPAKVSMSEALDRIVIVVNDEVITQREFDRVFLPIKRNLEQNFHGAELETKVKDAETGVKDHLINAKLATSLAKKKKISIDEEELSRRIETIKSAYYGSEQEFLMALRERGTNLTEFEREIREQMLAQKLVNEEVASSIVVTPGEIKELYDEHADEMVAPRQVLVRTIVIKKREDRSDEESMRKIRDVRARAVTGGDFSSLAMEMSEGLNAEEGGYMGYVAKGQTIPEIDSVIFALEKDKISEIVETPVGYHIFLVDEILEERMLELADVDDFLREQIYMKKFQESLVKYLEEQRKNAYISYK